jgi:hypothetical protein
MRLFLAFAFLSLAMAVPSYADLMSTASVNPFNGCGSPVVVNGTSSASASACTPTLGGSASTSINFGITSSTIATWTFSDIAAPQITSSTTSLFDQEFVVTGGTGTGFLTLNFVENGISGTNDPQASANATETASLNGLQYSNVRVCGNPPAMSGVVCMNPTVPIGVDFTYGAPFELSVELAAVAGGGLGGSNISGGGTLDYSLPSDAVLTTVPEPATPILMLTGIVALLLRKRTTI